MGVDTTLQANKYNECVSPHVRMVALTLTGWGAWANYLTCLCLDALSLQRQGGGVCRVHQYPCDPLHFPASLAVRLGPYALCWSVMGSRVALWVWSS